MTFVRTIRSLRVSLLALFVVAQVAGVIPLLYDHTLNVFEMTPVHAHKHPHVKPTVTNPEADHHHGALDLHDQCCVLHTLAAPLPYLTEDPRLDIASVRLVADDVTALTGGNPGVLDDGITAPHPLESGPTVRGNPTLDGVQTVDAIFDGVNAIPIRIDAVGNRRLDSSQIIRMHPVTPQTPTIYAGTKLGTSRS